jgi:outer membrane protein assembly factor BamB
MWRFAYPAPISIGLVSTPVAYGSRLLVSGNEGKGKVFASCLEMSAENGRVSFKECYASTELQTNNYNTPAIYKEAVFGFGGNRTAGYLHCTNLADGRLLWKDESRDWTSDQNLVIADGLILALTKGGELVMAEASREGYRELDRMQIDIDLGRPQQPTIANGRMYIRGNEAVICYQIGE